MNKIEKSLSPEQLTAFNAKLVGTPGLTLERIVALAKDEGVEISVMSAKRYRDKNFTDFLARLEAAKDAADVITSVTDNGQSYSEAAAALASQRVFEELMANPKQSGKELDRNSQIIMRLRMGDQKNKELAMRAEKLEAELAAVRRKEEEAKKAADAIGQNKKLSPEEKAAKLREIFGLPPIAPTTP